MHKKTREEFGLRNYIQIFEKSLNYIAGAFLSMLAAGIVFWGSKQCGNFSLKELFSNIDAGSKILTCVLVAILSTLPYYFYYNLKNNTVWNSSIGDKDNGALLKIYILYEIGIYSFFYLILQGDYHFALSKLILSSINVLLILIYLFHPKINKNVSGNRLSYFIAVLILLGIFFVFLSIRSGLIFSENADSQNITVLLLLILFSCNSGINLFFLTKWDSNEENGIISNRIKIMVPVISISIYTISTIYCFLAFENGWGQMIITSFWITLYEVAISLIKVRNSKNKVIICIVFFLIFVSGIPFILNVIEKNKYGLGALSINWLILIGISIYFAAIKYWGYILKILFVDRERKESKAKITSVMVWYHNSILGSMFFLLLILISSERYYLLLVTTLICSLYSEYFIIKYAFGKNIANQNKIYRKGRTIEFFSIILPVICFALGNFFELELISKLYFPVDSKVNAVMFSIFLICGMLFYSINRLNEKQISFDFDTKNLLSKLYKCIKKIKDIITQVIPDNNTGNFLTIMLSWCFYIIITASILDFVPFASKYKVLGGIIGLVIVISDWFLLSKFLFDYYIVQMKEGKRIMKFLKFFQEEWDKCLQTLDDFYEIDAKQLNQGDRLRPIMFFLGSCYKKYDNLKDTDYQNIARAACSLELIHKSSVMFDDYIDGDNMRKGEKTFHEQYPDTNTMILLGNAMLAKAHINFAECKDIFICDENAIIENSKELAQIIVDLCTGCYKELSRADYDKQNQNGLKEIIYLETVSLIKKSIVLGYRCFHTDQGLNDIVEIEKLGERFGYIFQFLNDLEPFSQRLRYEEHKGMKNDFDYGKKNIALFALYNECNDDKEKNIFNNHNYDDIIKLYKNHQIEKKILDMVKEERAEMIKILDGLNNGNESWINAFKLLFNYALEKKGWEEKILPLPK